MITGLQPAELPHSEMSGSKVVCTYPNLIAAYHVLLRLLEPRHPPFALSFFFYVKLLVLINLGSPRMTSGALTFINPNHLYIVNLIAFNLLVNNRLKNSIYYCFYIRQYVKDHCHFHIWSFTICSFGSVSESLFRAVRLYDDN